MKTMESIYSRAVLAGLVTWLVPFLISLLFYTNGGPAFGSYFFKTIMIVIVALTGAVMLVWFFRQESGEFCRAGKIFAVAAVVISWTLDLVVLLGMPGENPFSWFAAVGPGRYLVVAIMAIAAGYIAEEAVAKK